MQWQWRSAPPATHGGTFSHCTGVKIFTLMFISAVGLCENEVFQGWKLWATKHENCVLEQTNNFSSKNNHAWATHWQRLVLEVEAGPWGAVDLYLVTYIHPQHITSLNGDTDTRSRLEGKGSDTAEAFLVPFINGVTFCYGFYLFFLEFHLFSTFLTLQITLNFVCVKTEPPLL